MFAPDVLMLGPMMPLIRDGLEARFTVHRLWEAADPDAFLNDIAPRIRAVATGAHAHVDAGLIDRLPALEIIANFGVGYDTVDAAHAGARGVVVTNTPEVLTEEVADTAFGLLIMTVRELAAAERHLRAGDWLQRPYPLTPLSLRDRTIGIVGLGRIGKAIAKRADAFGIPVVYHNRRPAEDVPYRYYPSLHDMARDVNVLLVVVPGGAGTRHLIDASVLEALGSDGTLINIGRGSVVDEAALVQALHSGTIRAAGLDVFEAEPCFPKDLIALDRVVLLPHVGSASVHTRNAMGQLVVDNLAAWFERGAPITPVAETPWPRAFPARMESSERHGIAPGHRT
jgi:lactate dehydrogenase-like 2-hydroxyacid dehydrogenase